MSIPISPTPAKAGKTISNSRAPRLPSRSSASATKPDCQRCTTSRWSRWRSRDEPRRGSSQRFLQIEGLIRRVLRRQRAIHPETAATEHVVAGAVDGFDADELAFPVAEGGKRLLRGISAHHDLVIAGGEPRDLQLVVALIAPEPGLAVIGL